MARSVEAAPVVPPPAASPALVLLSVLVPTVPGREGKLSRLLAALDLQVNVRKDVELLVLRDSRGMTIGEKRNKLVSIARGDYVAFVDDDDAVSGDYVSAIVEALQTRPDVVNFLVLVEGHGPAKLCRYGLRLSQQNLHHEYQRRSNHVMAWRREIAATVQFPTTSFGEDTLWAEAMAQRAAVEVSLPRVLYTYQFDKDDNSSTRRA